MEYTDIELKNEQWRDIDGYDGMYQVSDLGRVRSRKRGEWKVLRPKKNNSGYLQVGLFKDENRQQPLVHRLVAQAFIPNYDNSKTIINHIDECKQNNRVNNLEYCTAQYNVTYNDIQFRKKNSKRRKIEKLYRPDLSSKENIEIFKANGFECSRQTILRLRKDLGLTKKHKFRNELKDIYDTNLSISDNIELFKSNGIECSKRTLQRLRKDLGITKHYRQRNLKRINVPNQR